MYAYRGAKAWILIYVDSWVDRKLLSELARMTAAELPAPNEKVRKKPKPA